MICINILVVLFFLIGLAYFLPFYERWLKRIAMPMRIKHMKRMNLLHNDYLSNGVTPPERLKIYSDDHLGCLKNKSLP